MGPNVLIQNFKTVVKRFTPALDTSAYAAGDVLFATTAVALREDTTKPTRGRVIFAGVLDKDDQTTQSITLWFLRSNVTFGTVNAAPSITDANGEEIVGKVVVSTGDDLGAFKIGQADGLSVPFELTGGTIWVAATTAGTPTHTASGMVVRLAFEIE